jgi:1,4-dihydroxy-6-naphthoate synthase
MNLTIGYSPCPNDCFIFDALINGKIDTAGITFEPRLEDVESLNRKALKGMLDITKLSFFAYAHVLEKYILLRSGSALGFNCGPILISKKHVANPELEIKSVAIPGQLTTANFLLSLYLPALKNKREYVFSEIENAVLNGEVDAGLIIHESRFTYAGKGLQKVKDLGEFWDALIHAPIPLGGIVMKRSIDPVVQKKVSGLIRQSVQHAFNHPAGAMPYVREHAQEMSDEVMKQHIGLYVNEFSLDLGKTGCDAIGLMFKKAGELGLVRAGREKLIIDP